MAIDTTTPRSRRAVIAGAVGGVLASFGLLAKAPDVRAGTDGDVVLDATNTAAGTTVINGDGSAAVLRVANADEDAVQAISANGVGLLGGSGDTSFPSPIAASTGVFGISVDGHGVYGASDTGHGIYAANNSATKAAIAAEGDPGTAIHGHAGPGPLPVFPVSSAILATAAGSRHGIQTYVEQGIALQAVSTESVGILASGDFDGIAGASSGGHTGVVGWSTDQDPPAVAPAGPLKTGVYGTASQDSSSRGVHGLSAAGRGVFGSSTTGLGVRGYSDSGVGGSFGTSAPNVGFALQTVGRVRFDKSAGIATILAGTSSVIVTPGIDLTSNSAVVATLMGNPGGATTVQRVAVNATADTLTIYLTANAVSNVKVAWHVFG